MSHIPLSEIWAGTAWEPTKPEYFLFPFFKKEIPFTPLHFSPASEIFRSNAARIVNTVSCGLQCRVARIQLDVSGLNSDLRNGEADDKISELDGPMQCKNQFDITPSFSTKIWGTDDIFYVQIFRPKLFKHVHPSFLQCVLNDQPISSYFIWRR
jgi:hypothetical protein